VTKNEELVRISLSRDETLILQAGLTLLAINMKDRDYAIKHITMLRKRLKLALEQQNFDTIIKNY
jgi:hypothetical protein